MKFIADVMLGKLAKRMRLLGFDVLYDTGYDDNQIIRLSLEQDRIILTRDTGLAGRPLAHRHLLIKEDQVQKQLFLVFKALHLRQSSLPLSRCSRCNERLEPMTKVDARQLVPDYVYEKHDRFLQCGKCKRIYWTGTHVRRMGLAETIKGPGKRIKKRA